MKLYIYFSGNNDLVYPIRKTFNFIIREKLIDTEILYCLKDSKGRLILDDIEEKINIENKEGYISIKDKKIINNNVRNYYKTYVNKSKKVRALDFLKLLDDKMLEEEKNIVIICGHGGPFQSLLDMESEFLFSINTRKFVEEIGKKKIDLLYLDMCAMNYIEIIYEIFKENNVKSILTYKGQAPYKEQNYNNLIDSIENKGNIENGVLDYMENSRTPLIYIKNNNLELEKIKRKFNELAIKCTKNTEVNFSNDIYDIQSIFNSFIIENKEAKKVKGLKLLCIKYYLDDLDDRIIYNQYKFCKNNLYKYLVSKDEKEKEPDIILLDKESLKHIIWLHNLNYTNNDLEKIISKLK